LWTCAELARTLVRDDVVDSISPQTVQRLLFSASASEAIEMVKRQVPRERTSDIGENQVPANYWPKLVDRLKNAPVLPESTAPRPDPLF